MRAVIRWVCADCLRSAEVEPGEGSPGAAPRTCAHCGGPVELHREDDSDEYATPLSLALTPEETPDWFSADFVPSGRLATPFPEQIGRFQLRASLGGGGFGQVYRAYDPRLDRDVALKVLREAHPTARVMERFFREARAAAQLDHPSIVGLHDAGRDEGSCWIAYQFVEGHTLSRLRDDGEALETVAAARIARDLADALDHAHRRGVLHRDVKPANVIVDPGGRARLTDFGLARRLDLDATMTIEGTILGTPAYMSPEQAAGRSHAADARSDVYSLGVLFYELLSGRRPSDFPSDVPAWRAELRGPMPPLERPDGRIPRALVRICRRSLAEDPADRYPDARSLADDLDSFLTGPPPRTRRIAGLALALGLLLGVVLGAIRPRVTPAPDALATPQARASRTAGAGRSSAIRLVLAPSRSSASRVFATPGNQIYHRDSCAALRRVDPADRVSFPGPAAAHAGGMVPCVLCDPRDPGAPATDPSP